MLIGVAPPVTTSPAGLVRILNIERLGLRWLPLWLRLLQTRYYMHDCNRFWRAFFTHTHHRHISITAQSLFGYKRRRPGFSKIIDFLRPLFYMSVISVSASMHNILYVGISVLCLTLLHTRLPFPLFGPLQVCVCRRAVDPLTTSRLSLMSSIQMKRSNPLQLLHPPFAPP